MSGDSEEKTLDPTDHKLQKAREKGQVASSADFVGGLSVAAGICYLIFAWPSITASATRMLDLAMFSIVNSGPERGLAVFLTMVFELGYVVAPFIMVIVFVGVLANILEKQGIPFSLHPVTPDFAKINPGEGLKKLFARRNMTEFATSFVKICIWFAFTGLFLWLFIGPILSSPFCSIGCVMESALGLGLIIVAIAVIMLAATGLLDLPLQTMLFNHEQKMGHKEMKQEMKEILGSPEFKSHRRKEHRKLLNKSSKDGKASGEIRDGKKGVSAIIRGFDAAVGIYFHPVEADVPVVIARYSGASFAKKMTEAESRGIPVEYDQSLMNDLLKTVDVGRVIRERHFEKVAKVLIRSGALG